MEEYSQESLEKYKTYLSQRFDNLSEYTEMVSMKQRELSTFVLLVSNTSISEDVQKHPTKNALNDASEDLQKMIISAEEIAERVEKSIIYIEHLTGVKYKSIDFDEIHKKLDSINKSNPSELKEFVRNWKLELILDKDK